jgi:hypothetical protein
MGDNMKIQPTQNNFTSKNVVIQYIKQTSYGKCIHGKSARGLDYDVYVATDERTGNVVHKLYCVTKNNKWVRSILRFFSGNKVYKELKSQAK